MATYHSPAPKRIRTRLLIFPQFQLILVGANITIMLVVFGICWIQMAHSMSDLTVLAGLTGTDKGYYQHYLEYQNRSLEISFFLSMITGLVLSTLLTLAISHRFSGPLIRLRRYFESITRGTRPVPRLSFRKGDFLGDLPPLVNEAIDQITDRETGKPARSDDVPEQKAS